MYPEEKVDIVYITEFWFWGIFTKDVSRDLSYETDSGPKTKTGETWDLAY